MTAEQRVEALDEARGVITKDRNSSYGNPEDNFAAIAGFWTQWLKWKHGFSGELDTHDVAMLMTLMKTGRIATGAPMVKDNYVDHIGYAGIAWEQAIKCYSHLVPLPFNPETLAKGLIDHQ